MRFLYLLPASFLTLVCPLAGSSQTAATLPRRFYLALSATQGSYRLPDYELPATFSPSLTAGVQLFPRLTLQISVANYHYRDEGTYNTTYYPYTPPTQPTISVPSTVTTTTSLQVIPFPILFRFQARQYAEGKILLELLSGMTIANTKSRTTYLEVSTTQAVYKSTHTEDASTRAYLPLGGALRCKVLPNLDLAAELIGQLPLSFAKKNSLGFNNVYLNTTTSATLFYHFGSVLQQEPRQPL
jgi:hypothetical protein